jgi:hypothetical protein
MNDTRLKVKNIIFKQDFNLPIQIYNEQTTKNFNYYFLAFVNSKQRTIKVKKTEVCHLKSGHPSSLALITAGKEKANMN